jgi:hypothetical protein
VKTDLRTFSRSGNGNEELDAGLKEATKERYDYSELLRRFMSSGEDIHVNDDEFDYIYYTYGIEKYGNMPLIEPLEYKENEKIR